MKTVSPSDFNTLSGIKLELSKYRLSQPKVDASLTKKQSQTIAKPPSFQSRKNKTPSIEQFDTKNIDPRLNVTKSKEIHMLGRKPSFSVFFPREEEPTLSIPSLSEVAFTEPNASDIVKLEKREEKSVPKKKTTVEIVQLREPAKNPKNRKAQHTQQPRVQVWSFLDLSDKEDEESVTANNSKGESSRKSIRNTEQTMATSYITTLPDEDYQREERRCNTENNLEIKAELIRNSEEVARLNKRIKDLEDKNGKWELFGRLIGKCYQATRRERNYYKMQNELDKKSIAALKEQVGTLKTISRTEKSNTAKAMKKAEQESEENKLCILTLKGLEEKLIAFNNDNKRLKNQVAQLKQENKELKTTQETRVEKYKADTEHYKAIAEGKLKECSSLAEEIICLRTDLDRTQFKYAKAQKELQGSITPPSLSKKTSDDPSTGGSQVIQTKSRTKSMDRQAMEKLVNGPSVDCASAKQVTFLETLDDINTPSPRTFKMMPLIKEADVLIKE